MKAVVQPRLQPGLGTCEVYAGHADLGESALVRPSLQPSSQADGVDPGTLPAMLRSDGGRSHRSMMAATCDAATGCPVPPASALEPAAAPCDERHWHWPDEAACAAAAAALAARIASAPGRGDATIELSGPLGAGKTTFVRHLLRALGVQGRIKSPTYTVVEPYRAGDLDVAHFDFYRFGDARELVDAGLREMFAAPGLKLVEWPSRAGEQRPAADLSVEIEPLPDDSRRVRASALTWRGRELLA